MRLLLTLCLLVLSASREFVDIDHASTIEGPQGPRGEAGPRGLQGPAWRPTTYVVKSGIDPRRASGTKPSSRAGPAILFSPAAATDVGPPED